MKERSHQKKKRKVAVRELVQNAYYIFCEGVKTEPQYFRDMGKLIAQNAAYVNVVKIVVEGTGLNTKGIIEYSKQYIQKNNIKTGQIWCVFDKDDFPAENFDQAMVLARKYTKNANGALSYHIAWSNECIEYWFLLHFYFLDANISRFDYIERLNQIFKEKESGKYHKNMEGLFNILNTKGNPKQAIKWAEKRLHDYTKDELESHPSKITPPATMVQVLVGQLAKYFPNEIKEKYL